MYWRMASSCNLKLEIFQPYSKLYEHHVVCMPMLLLSQLAKDFLSLVWSENKHERPTSLNYSNLFKWMWYITCKLYIQYIHCTWLHNTLYAVFVLYNVISVLTVCVYCMYKCIRYTTMWQCIERIASWRWRPWGARGVIHVCIHVGLSCSALTDWASANCVWTGIYCMCNDLSSIHRVFDVPPPSHRPMVRYEWLDTHKEKQGIFTGSLWVKTPPTHCTPSPANRSSVRQLTTHTEVHLAILLRISVLPENSLRRVHLVSLVDIDK